MSVLLLAVLLQIGDLDSKDPAVARRAFESVIYDRDEKALVEAARTSARARLALAEIRAHKRFGECYPPVALITFSAKGQPVQECVEAFEKVLAMPVEDYGRHAGLKPTDVVNLELKDAYPLEAVDRIMNEVNGQWWYRGNVIHYSRGWTRRSPHLIHWRHALFFPWMLENERWVDAVGATGRSFAFKIVFRHDGFSRIAGVLNPRGVEAIDESGAALQPQDATSDPEFHTWFAQANFQIRLKAPGEKVEKISRLSGVLPVLIPEKRVWKEVPVGAGRTEVAFPHMKVAIEGFAAPGSSVRVAWLGQDAKKPSVLPDERDFELEGKDGKRISPTGAKWLENNSTLDFVFDLPAGFTAAKLRVGSFESLGEHEIPFEFREIRLR